MSKKVAFSASFDIKMLNGGILIPNLKYEIELPNVFGSNSISNFWAEILKILSNSSPEPKIEVAYKKNVQLT